MIDANEYLDGGKLARPLTQLVIRDLFKEITGEKIPATHFRGKNHIDGIWATNKLMVMRQDFFHCGQE